FTVGSSALAATATFATATDTLAVTVVPSGSGTVTSAPAGISCPGTCTVSFTVGTVITLSETPSAGYSFTSWSGACTGSGACPLPLGSPLLAVTPPFAPPPPSTLTVTLSPSAGGTVTSSPPGVSCPGTC